MEVSSGPDFGDGPMVIGCRSSLSQVHPRGVARTRCARESACLAAAPRSRSTAGFFSMNAFEPLFWMLFVLLLVRIVQAGESRLAVLTVGDRFMTPDDILTKPG
jgi:hypothetical protein